MATSMSDPPIGTALPLTKAPRASMAMPEVPPPTSTTMLPTGSWMGKPAPMAAASGSSTRDTDRAPAAIAASATALRSTSVRSGGTHTSTRGRGNLDVPSLRRIRRNICSASSKLVITHLCRGREGVTSAGERWASSQASRPKASTSPVREFIAHTVGSLKTTPCPCRYTRVLADPRSTARSRRLMGSRAHDPLRGPGGEALLLTDRDVLLDPLDPVPRGLECFGSMGCRAAHDNGRLPDLEVTGAMEDGHATDRPAVQDLLAYRFQSGNGPLFPRLVLEGCDMACLRLVTDGPCEQNRPPRPGTAHERQGLRSIEGGIGQTDQELVTHRV